MSAAALALLVALTYPPEDVAQGATRSFDLAQDTVVVEEDLEAPESAVHDREADVYFVSNVNGSATEMDNNGYISRISPEGEVLDAQWIGGEEATVALHAPKGMAIEGDTLYVADVNAIHLFNRTTGEPLQTWYVTEATFLNDVALDEEGTLYATDTGTESTEDGAQQTGTDAVYRFGSNGTPEVIARGDSLQGPNGIVLSDEGPIVVTADANEVYRIDAEGQRQVIAQLPQGQLDGIVQLDDGTLFVSSWEGEAVYRVDLTGAQTPTAAVEGVTSPADIGYDQQRQRLLIPQLEENQLRIVPAMRAEQQLGAQATPQTDRDTMQAAGEERPTEQEQAVAEEQRATTQAATGALSQELTDAVILDIFITGNRGEVITSEVVASTGAAAPDTGITQEDTTTYTPEDTAAYPEEEYPEEAPQTAQANESVQAFAQRMIDTHSSLINQAQQLADSLEVRPESNLVSMSLQSTVQGIQEELRETSADSLDQQYMLAQVTLHQQFLAMLDHTLAPNAQQEEIRNLLQAARETVAQHLEEAKMLYVQQAVEAYGPVQAE